MNRKEKREFEKEANYFLELIKIKKHFFKDLDKELFQISDPRNQSYITYDTDVLLTMALFKNMFNLKSMNGMTESLNKDECIGNLKRLFEQKDTGRNSSLRYNK